MGTVTIGWPLAALVLALAVAAGIAARWAQLGRGRDPLIAAARAALQLGLASLVIAFVLRSLAWTALFVAVMACVAAGTSARRISGTLRPRSWWTLLPIVAGLAPTLTAILASGAIRFEPIVVLPTAGILIGGAMTATTLAGRRAREELTDQRGAYEAALSIGLTRRAAVSLVARPAAALALVPGLDQTRTAGLVTLPGAFVGMLLAGASPAQAGAAQVIVLVALLLVQTLATAVTLEMVAAGLLQVGEAPLPV